MFVIHDMQTVFRALYVDKITLYVHTRFHILSSTCSLGITIKLKGKGKCLVAAVISSPFEKMLFTVRRYITIHNFSTLN
jgi:hypothetical protein